MNIQGQQLHIVSAAEVIGHADRLGVCVIVELSPYEGRGSWVARVVVSHALLPGRRQVLGLLTEDADEVHTDLIIGATAEGVEAKAAAALSAIAKRVRFARTPDRPAQLEAAEATVLTEGTKHLH